MASAFKDKKNLFLSAAIAFVVIIILLIAFFPKPRKAETGPDVISKRVKLNIIDETVKVGEEGTQTAQARPAPGSAPDGHTSAPEPRKAPVEARKRVDLRPVETPVIKPASPVKKAGKAAKKVRTASVDRAALAAKRPWAINVASFPNRDGALRLAKALGSAGYNSYVTVFTKDGVDWNRVRVGFYASKADAKKAGDRIKRRYKVQSPWIVLPTRDETAGHIR
ncbi:MAG: SPOR domain-containing protein [Thermodesulfobacteriota bacterium]